jgi:hypothetical protein
VPPPRLSLTGLDGTFPSKWYSKMRFIVFSAILILGATAVAAAATRDVMIALKPRNIQALESILYDVSTPTSPNYGKCVLRKFLSTFPLHTPMFGAGPPFVATTCIVGSGSSISESFYSWFPLKCLPKPIFFRA